MYLPQNAITVTTVLPHHIYCPREIFHIPAVITVVTAVLPLFPLPCHPLSYTKVVSRQAGRRNPTPGDRATSTCCRAERHLSRSAISFLNCSWIR